MSYKENISTYAREVKERRRKFNDEELCNVYSSPNKDVSKSSLGF
jgi:hypothetical protein